ncbi:hypothetical protein SMKI_07G1770 [Saccharomyces mikatae IFO 1815]|uniref:Monopolar spindle protein 2 n=1 Tax=Saccharomyces mikatae IFO 1815 TaxID=226126 RepID=A0AA35IZ70_SACMI|nr:uncharacterized protein SMKI_07G1770 [Saccharomyces mikatae IFO 1815]CAI4039203.1 hypothetical protein SMKI_07G1770 [Saccharomyces mikatae IFO 1815]
MSMEDDVIDGIFKYAWDQIDKPISGDFIYGKDLPKLIEIIEDIFQKAQKNGSYDLRLPLFSGINTDLFRTFSNTKTFFKIHKEEFDDIFFNLINRSFKEVLEDAFIDLDYIPRDFLVSVDSKSSSESLVENKNKNIQERGVLTPGRKPTEPPSKVVNQNNIGDASKVQVEELQRELNTKQKLLQENERQVNELKRRLEIYHEKYASIHQQFSDLQKTRQAENNQDFPRTADSESSIVAGIDQKAILEEFKSRLQRQTDTISFLKDQIRRERGLNYSNDKVALLKRKSSISEGDFISNNYADLFSSRLWVKAIIRILICFLLLAGVFPYIKKLFYGHDTPSQNSRLQLSWWESSGILSKIVWFFEDHTDLETEYASTAKVDDAYSKVFGI